ncbi:MAG TPA: GntR family transcriptional regulator [Acidimicrobiia bacterium]|nr:GntR family transcriptional regulator [Acidimicrobiia bacterium]
MTTTASAPRLPPHTDPRFERRTSAQHAAAYIRRLVLDGTLPPGTHVPQDEIATALGVSRIPVREALIALEREGWVTLQTHRGAFVNRLDEQLIRDHYELFGVLYGFAAERAAETADADAIAQISELERAISAARDPAEIERLAIAFHAAIVSTANSPRLKVLLRAMSSIVPGNVFEVVGETVAIEKRGQALIARALRRSDGERAAAEYRRLMRRIGDQVVRYFHDRGVFAA